MAQVSSGKAGQLIFLSMRESTVSSIRLRRDWSGAQLTIIRKNKGINTL
jgi:hypothetical protein